MWSSSTLDPSLFTYSHKSFSISYKLQTVGMLCFSVQNILSSFHEVEEGRKFTDFILS